VSRSTNDRQLTLFRHRRCIYCNGAAESGEHVPTKRLLESPYPRNLITVPSCRSCNNGYARDEEYFLAALAQVGFVDTLQARLQEGGAVDRMLKHSSRLDDRIIRSLTVGDDGKVCFTPEAERINRVAHKTAIGLYYSHYETYARQADFYPVVVHHTHRLPTFIVAIVHTERFMPKRWTRVQKGVFEYIFVRDWTTKDRLLCIMNFHNTLWAAVGCPCVHRKRLLRERPHRPRPNSK
jgi:hypothetical protein